MVVYFLLFAWARLLPQVIEQIWRIRWVLLVLFILDWWIISLELALIVTLRLMLLASVFTLVFSTTTPIEFSQALERLKSPYRYAFSLTLAFQSLETLGEEWQAIQEAQRVRGIYPETRSAPVAPADQRIRGADRPGDRIDHQTRLVYNGGRLCARFRFAPPATLPGAQAAAP